MVKTSQVNVNISHLGVVPSKRCRTVALWTELSASSSPSKFITLRGYNKFEDLRLIFFNNWSLTTKENRLSRLRTYAGWIIHYLVPSTLFSFIVLSSRPRPSISVKLKEFDSVAICIISTISLSRIVVTKIRNKKYKFKETYWWTFSSVYLAYMHDKIHPMSSL